MITAKIYQDGKYVESIICESHYHAANAIILCSDPYTMNIVAHIPFTMMVVFKEDSQPDYDKMEKELREKKS